jgi:outer membrane protein TolC
MEKQYQEGIIPSTEWQNQLITLAEKELEVEKAQDQLLISRLSLAHFLGI